MIKKILILLIAILFVPSILFATGNDANTKSLLHCNGVDGSTTFTDVAAGGTHTWAANGSAQVDDAQFKFNQSGLFDGNGDYLNSTDSADWQLGGGTGNFTVDFWVRFSSVAAQRQLFNQYVNSQNYWSIDWNDNNYLRFFNLSSNAFTIYVSAPWTPSADIWYHIAVVRNGTGTGCVTFYVNGVPLVSELSGGAWNGAVSDFAGDLLIGCYGSLTTPAMAGWLDEIRISDTARFTADFSDSLPSAEYDDQPEPSPTTYKPRGVLNKFNRTNYAVELN